MKAEVVLSRNEFSFGVRLEPETDAERILVGLVQNGEYTLRCTGGSWGGTTGDGHGGVVMDYVPKGLFLAMEPKR